MGSIFSNKRIQTGINIASSLVVLIVSALINFFLSPYIISNVGETANGFVQLANNFVTYASLITIAINSMASRFVSVNYHSNKKKKASIYYTSAFMANIVIVIFLFIISVFLVFKIDIFMNVGDVNITDIQLLFTFVFINFFLSQISTVLNIFLYVTNRIYISNLLSMICNLLRAIFLFYLFSSNGSKLYFVTLSSCIIPFVTIIVLFLLKKRSDCEIKLAFSLFRVDAIKELVSSGIWNTINQCGNILMTGMDLLFANWFINPVQMGVLSVAKIMPTYLNQIAQNINSSIAPGMLITSTIDTQTYVSEIKNMVKMSTLILVVPVTIFIMFSYSFYSLWVPTINAKDLTVLSTLSMFSLIPLSGVQVLYNVFTINNRLKVNSITFLITGILNILIVLLFVKYSDYGIYAISGSSVFLTILRNVFILVPYSSKILGLKWNYFYRNIYKAIISSFATVIVSILVLSTVNVDTWTKLMIAIIITAVIAWPACSIFVLGKHGTLTIISIIIKRKREHK